jgi:selenocysteine-specific elongation factor
MEHPLHVIGTAGHVDHGKTLLIEALTGINADRLPEEKRRGLTIDLGFAHFFTPEGEAVGVIDVPGHERFIRNMVAGAWALDLALLTVAADDGWMQQSSDHTRVLRLMGVPRLIGVVTKVDLASPERVGQVVQQVTGQCSRLGYPSVPIIAVSARSGEGIGELRELILRGLAATAGPGEPGQPAGSGKPAGSGQPQRSPAGSRAFAHLYVDRAFSVKGSGLVITGSLRGGVLQRGQELLLLPQKRRVRIRGLQAYYREQERVEPTCRVAINLSGVDAGRVARGDLLCEGEGPYRVATEFILRLHGGADEKESPSSKRDTEAEIAAGTGHQIARLTRLARGSLLRVRLQRATALRWNQPVVLIRQGGSTILGGGSVLWLGKTGREQRSALAELEPTLKPELGPEDRSRVKLALEGAIPPVEAEDLQLSEDLRGGTVRIDGWIVTREIRDRLSRQIREMAAAPGGVRLDELTGKLRERSEALPRLVAGKLVQEGALSLRGGILFPSGQQAPQVSPMGRQLLRDLEAGGFRGLELAKLKIAGARRELRNLVRADLAVVLEGDIYYDRQVYLDLVRRCLADTQVGGVLTIAQTKDRSGLSRKFVIPLLNRMERDGFVKRSGDERIVTGKPQAPDP